MVCLIDFFLCLYFCTARINHTNATAAEEKAAVISESVAYVNINTTKTLPVSILVDSAGLSLLKTDGNKSDKENPLPYCENYVLPLHVKRGVYE